LSIGTNGYTYGNHKDIMPINELSKKFKRKSAQKEKERATRNSGPGTDCATKPLGEGMQDNDIPAFMATASAGSAGLANGPDAQHVRNLHPSAQ
jgi:hypothetical protein